MPVWRRLAHASPENAGMATACAGTPFATSGFQTMETAIRTALTVAISLAALPACGGSSSEGTANTLGSGATGGGGQGGTSGNGGSGGTGAGPSDCRATALTELASDGAQDMSPRALYSDGHFLNYVSGFSELVRVPVNGGQPQQLHQGVTSFAAASSELFYATALGEIGALRNGAATPLVTGHVARGLAVGADRLFWAEPNDAGTQSGLFSVARSGGAATPLATRAARVGGLQVRDDAMFWIEQSPQIGTGVVRAGLDGSAPAVVLPQIEGLVAFEVAGDALVIATQSEVTVGPLAGGQRRTLVTDTDLRGIAVSGETLYYARNDACVTDPNQGNGSPVCKGKVFSVPIAGGTPTELFSTAGAPAGLAVDSACLYVRHVVGQCHPGCSATLAAAPR